MGRYGLSLGNITGNDIFNILGLLGLTGMIRAVEVEAAATASLAGLCVMVLVTVLFLRTGLDAVTETKAPSDHFGLRTLDAGSRVKSLTVWRQALDEGE